MQINVFVSKATRFTTLNCISEQSGKIEFSNIPVGRHFKFLNDDNFQDKMASSNLLKPLSSLSRLGSLQTRSVSLKAANIPIAKYGGRHTVTMMPGDGIGPEMMGYVKEVFRYAGAPIDFETVLLDPTTDNYDDLYNAISSVKRNGVGIKGNIETKMNRPDIKSRNVEMRNELDLFVNTILCKSQPGVKTRHDDIDIVVSNKLTQIKACYTKKL